MDRKTRIVNLISTRYGGSQAAFARAIGKAPAVVWQIVSGHRNVGEALAATIERKLGLPRHYLDGADSNALPRISEEDAQLLANLQQLLPEQQQTYRRQIAADADQARKVIEHARNRGLLPDAPAISDDEVSKHIRPAPRIDPSSHSPTKLPSRRKA